MKEDPNESDVWLKLCDNFLSTLSDMINQAIIDANQISETKSWKQRMNTKKQAWGACQAISHILRHSSLLRKETNKIFERSITSLVRCVENAHSINEKITISALHCLSHIETETWKYLSSKTGIRAQCLAACVTNAQLKSSIPGIATDVHSIIFTLMQCLNEQDIRSFLHGNENIQENLENLYIWMVDNCAGSEMFEAFGEVMSTTSLYFDFSIVQKFKSRAIYEERRRAQSNGDSRLSEESDASNDDDEL